MFIERAKGKVKVIPPEIEHFQIDFSAFEQAVTCRTKGVIINPPTTPPAWSTPARRWKLWQRSSGLRKRSTATPSI